MSNPQSQPCPNLMKPLPALPSPKHKSLQIINEDPEQEREFPQTPIRGQTFPKSLPSEVPLPNFAEPASKVRSLPDASSLKSWRRTHTLITPDSSPEHSGKKPKACLSNVEDSNSLSSACLPLVTLETGDDNIDMELLERLTTPPRSGYRCRTRPGMMYLPRDLGLSPPMSTHRPFTRKTSATNLHQHFRLAGSVESSSRFSPDGQCPSSCHSVGFWTEDDNFADSASSADHDIFMEDSDTEMMESDTAGVRPSFLALLLGIDRLRARV